MMRPPFMPFIAAVLLAGCAVGPDYQRPALALPAQYPGSDAAAGGAAGTDVPAQWWTLYGQPELDRLVAQAL